MKHAQLGLWWAFVLAFVTLALPATVRAQQPVQNVDQNYRPIFQPNSPSNSFGMITPLAANTSQVVCPNPNAFATAPSNSITPVAYEVQIYGNGPVLLGLDGQTLTSVTPVSGTTATIPTQYSLYIGTVARANAITAYSATAQTITCNVYVR